MIEPAPVQKPHPPLWIGAAEPQFDPAMPPRTGFNLLLGQGGSPETGRRRRRRSTAAPSRREGRAYDSSMVGPDPRPAHRDERHRNAKAARALRAKFMRQVQQLSLSPTGRVADAWAGRAGDVARRDGRIDRDATR